MENGKLGLILFGVVVFAFLQRTQSSTDPSAKSHKLAVATRIHRRSSSSHVAFDKIVRFCRESNEIAQLLIICVDVGDDLENVDYVRELKVKLAAVNEGVKIQLVAVTPWGNYCAALNAAVETAVKGGCSRILFQVSTTRSEVSSLSGYMDRDPEVVVVGKVLDGHIFQEGVHQVTGRKCPWNTLALWSLPMLSLIGFPMVADGIDNEYGGVEEVVALSLLQVIRPDAKAILVSMPSTRESEWATEFRDEKRAAYHNQKMASKDTRPAKQLNLLGIAAGTVVHLSC